METGQEMQKIAEQSTPTSIESIPAQSPMISRRAVLRTIGGVAGATVVAGAMLPRPEVASAQGPAPTPTLSAAEQAEIQRIKDEAARRAARNPPPVPPPPSQAPAAPKIPEKAPKAPPSPPAPPAPESKGILQDQRVQRGLIATGVAGLVGAGYVLGRRREAAPAQAATVNQPATAETTPPAPQRKWWWPFGKKPADRQVSPPGPEASAQPGEQPYREIADLGIPITPAASVDALMQQLTSLGWRDDQQTRDYVQSALNYLRAEVSPDAPATAAQPAQQPTKPAFDVRAEHSRIFGAEATAQTPEPAPQTQSAPEAPPIVQPSEQAYREIVGKMRILITPTDTVDTLMEQLKHLPVKPWEDNQPTRDHIQSALNFLGDQMTKHELFLPPDVDPKSSYGQRLAVTFINTIMWGGGGSIAGSPEDKDIQETLRRAGYTFETRLLSNIILEIYDIRR